jgi:hypothetical protein
MYVQGPGDMLGLVSAEYVQYGSFDVCSYKTAPVYRSYATPIRYVKSEGCSQ